MTRRFAILLAVLLTLPCCEASAADVAVRRSMESQETIARIIIQTAWGAVEDVIGRNDGRMEDSGRWLSGIADRVKLSSPQLTIDGQPRTGFFAWLAALDRVAGYALDRQHAGSVGYRYRLRVRGHDIWRETRITDGSVLLTTSTGWTEVVPIAKRIVRRIPIHVVLRITATERSGKTLLVGTAVGRAGLSDFRCNLIRSVAGNRAEAELREGLSGALQDIERLGLEYYASGADIGPILDRLRAGIAFGGRLRR